MEKQLTIFLVDDDIDDQEVFEYVMKKVSPGAKLEFARDGIHALERINEGSFDPDVIFLDINMPRMDGLRCLEELKKISRLDGVPIYLYSTSDESDIPERHKMHSSSGYIKKHINTDDVEKEFQRIIDNLSPKE